MEEGKMISKEVKKIIEGSKVIQAMFDDARMLEEIHGAGSVCDFTIGNPNVPAPEEFKQAVIDVLKQEDPLKIHGYMSNAGFDEVRDAVAEHLNREHGTAFHRGNIIMTAGAAGGLNVIFKTLLDEGQEVVAFAPYFSEYRHYVHQYGGKLVLVPANPPEFQPDLKAMESLINAKTKAVIINSPNNPTGVIYSEETIIEMSRILKLKEEEYGHAIYLISDEPYRELVFDGGKVPYVTRYYDDTIVAYSYSKSLSLPGERIGYLVLPDELSGQEDIFAGACTVTRTLGFMNACSLVQLALARCLDCTADISYYDKNRRRLVEALTAMGYEMAPAVGGFYLFIKAPGGDEERFLKVARENLVLLVSGTDFGCPGYVRMAYCTSYETIEKALPRMEKVMATLLY